MSNALYELYRNSRQMLSFYHKTKKEHDPEALHDMVEGWQNVINTLDECHPQIKEWYERNKEIQQSFTPAQIDFICYQIGEWYVDWQDRMWIKDKPNQHWLGRAKEQLKTMICGD